MADSAEQENGFMKIAEEARTQMMNDVLEDPITRVQNVYHLWGNCAELELFIISPTISQVSPPIIIRPEKEMDSEEYEHVYDIHDYGNKLSASKGAEMYTAGMSMCKMFYTIEKMIHLLIERLKTGGVNPQTEVQVALSGHEVLQRKAFEVIINCSEWNILVTNFDPGLWGERYLENVRRLADKGYGYPPEAPRDVYRHHHGTASVMKTR